MVIYSPFEVSQKLPKFRVMTHGYLLGGSCVAVLQPEGVPTLAASAAIPRVRPARRPVLWGGLWASRADAADLSTAGDN